MHDDCSACASSISLSDTPVDAAAHTMPAPPEFNRPDDRGHESPRSEIKVPDATADLAARMHLHFH